MRRGRINANGDAARALATLLGRVQRRRSITPLTAWRLAKLALGHSADGIPLMKLMGDLCRAGMHPADAAVLVAWHSEPLTTPDAFSFRSALVTAAALTRCIDVDHVRTILRAAGEDEGETLAADIEIRGREEYEDRNREDHPTPRPRRQEDAGREPLTDITGCDV